MTGQGGGERTPSATGADGVQASGAAGWVSRVAQVAAAEADAPIDLLGEYLVVLADAALTGRRPGPVELGAVRRLGERAAEQGVDANRAVDLYLTAAWRLWQQIPTVVRSRDRDQVREAAEAVLRVVNDAVEVLVAGHQSARRQMIRQEESARRDFIDDLLRGDADVARLVQRAEPFGLDLGRSHQVLLAAPEDDGARLPRAAAVLERVIVDRFGDRDVLVATKDNLVVVLVPSSGQHDPAQHAGDDLAGFTRSQLSRHDKTGQWQVAAGRAYPGAYGVARSYEEAREALLLARRLQVAAEDLQTRDLLVYRVLGRDQAALVDLVHALLQPLTSSRGGAEPLLETMETYFATGGVATETARLLHLSVRTVTYRLARVKALTGHDPAAPAHRLSLQMAVRGARLLDWPAHDLPGVPPLR